MLIWHVLVILCVGTTVKCLVTMGHGLRQGYSAYCAATTKTLSRSLPGSGIIPTSWRDLYVMMLDMMLVLLAGSLCVMTRGHVGCPVPTLRTDNGPPTWPLCTSLANTFLFFVSAQFWRWLYDTSYSFAMWLHNRVCCHLTSAWPLCKSGWAEGITWHSNVLSNCGFSFLSLKRREKV